MWQAVTVDVLHMQRDHFGTRDASQLRRHAVTTEGIVPTVAVPLRTVISPEVTGASNVKTAL
jgi:hypothetical protein